MKKVCSICPRHCSLLEGQTGFCKGRSNINGKISCNNYGKLTSFALDPIEKKPFARFHEGSQILSIGSYGCNLACPFCQNSEISMADESCETVFMLPKDMIQKALDLIPVGNVGIAFTYNEPLIGYEYVLDCAKLAKENGLLTVLVSNGFICKEPLLELLPYIDALNIDLKGYTQNSYDFVQGNLETVKDTIRMAEKICHIEVTTLIVPDMNESISEMEEEAKWLASINPNLPLHISRFFPCFQMKDKKPTSIATIYQLEDIAKKYLNYVYRGNC